ncbi:MAG: HAD-IC family P-type ATPase [Ignavibacteria bacterium]|nr:HAD-IC family P-type ATPase [Ignavibacteria bacterium]
MEYKGLSDNEIRDRIKAGLVNKISKQKTKTVREIFIENIFSLFNFIILGIIIFVLIFYIRSFDSRLLLDCIGIMTVAVINTFIAIYQETKAKRALDKVNLLLKRKVNVIRNGREEEIEQSEIVKDDLIIVRRGDQIVVDSKAVKSDRLEIDESLLTGESLPVLKEKDDELLSGSFCVAGSGYIIANKIGDESYATAVTNLAKKYKFTLTPLQKQLNFFLKFLFGLAILLVIIKIIVGSNTDMPEVDFVREIATILSSLVPQGLILTASVTYALGVYRISKIGAIIQKLNAVESFSNVQVVCMDKTGTLTQNKLRVAKLTSYGDTYTADELQILIGTFAHSSIENNATSKALEEYPASGSFEKIDELPFSSSTKFSAIQFRYKNEEKIFILGAYDILEESTDGDSKTVLSKLFEENKLDIYRNLLFGIAKDEKDVNGLKSKSGNFSIEPLCIISISDTIRDDVYDAIKLFKNNGITFKILSGDSSSSIKAIMREIGWDASQDKFISGKEFDNIPDSEIEKVINEKEVFSRLMPEHKLKIIKTLKSQKIYTAMIGDGVNDLPAIKESDMGIAMEEGSAITKEVADIVLLKNKFSLLPQIFDEGNKIVNSVSSVSKLFLTKNFIVIYLTILSYITFIYPLTPRRVSLLNIFAIGLPALIITLKNVNTGKVKKLLPDVLSYILISAAIITGMSYLGYFIMDIAGTTDTGLKYFTMMSVLVIMSVFNFIIVSRYTLAKRFIFYLYGGGLILFFFLLTAINFDFGMFDLIKVFYEINTIGLLELILVIIISTAGFLLMRYINKQREKFITIDKN